MALRCKKKEEEHNRDTCSRLNGWIKESCRTSLHVFLNLDCSIVHVFFEGVQIDGVLFFYGAHTSIYTNCFKNNTMNRNYTNFINFPSRREMPSD